MINILNRVCIMGHEMKQIFFYQEIINMYLKPGDYFHNLLCSQIAIVKVYISLSN